MPVPVRDLGPGNLDMLVTNRNMARRQPMKFGMRSPSFKKMISARTSPARYVRHSLGIKASRGWGWLTNPKKAAYNRVYSRTTFSVWSVLKSLFGGKR